MEHGEWRNGRRWALALAVCDDVGGLMSEKYLEIIKIGAGRAKGKGLKREGSSARMSVSKMSMAIIDLSGNCALKGERK